MKLPLPSGFPTEVHVVDAPDPGLFPEGPWTLIGDMAIREVWRDQWLPEPPGTRWVSVSESSKRLESLVPWLEHWAEMPLHRDVTVVAVGGGVLTDMAGLAASLFLRGVEWQVWPTTLLAQADAALGGKTAVNLSPGKNLAGAFHPPNRLVACTRFLQGLPDRQLRAGRWELVKDAFIQGDMVWASGLLDRPLPKVEDLARALRHKAELVHEDLREQGVRRLLNLGHTLGHALEAGSEHALLHGEAVGLGLLAACLLSEAEGVASFPESLLQKLCRELRPLAPQIPGWETCLPLIHRDKKAWTDPSGFGLTRIHCILPVPDQTALQRSLPPEAWQAPHGRMIALLS